MNFNINTDINLKNLNLAINYLFNTENISHQAIIINELTKKIQSKEVLISLRKYIYSRWKLKSIFLGDNMRLESEISYICMSISTFMKAIVFSFSF